MIRIASPQDALRIAEIQVASWQHAYRGLLPDSLLDGLDVSRRQPLWEKFCSDPQAPVFLASEEAVIVGFCHLNPARDKDLKNAAEIAALYLDPSFCRQGYGSALCQSSLDFAREQGFESLCLWVLETNLPARSFYEAQGFSHDGKWKTELLQNVPLNEVRYSLWLRAVA